MRAVPLDLLIKNQGNMYKLTCATIKRAVQINMAGDEELENYGGKVVSLALNQILSKKVDYQIEG